MRMPWHRDRIPPERREEAEAAVSDAEARYQEAVERAPRVQRVVADLKEIRREDTVGKLLRARIEGGRHAGG
jgi:hypothetical protein